MKKFLLSLAVLAFGANIMNAENVVLCVNDATNIVGEEHAEVPAEGNSAGQARRYQPLQSLEIDGWNFTFDKGTATTEPAYYFTMSTSSNTKYSVRIYNGSSATITAPAGKKFTKIDMLPDNKTTSTTIYSGAAVDSYTIKATATTRIYELTITLDDGSGVAPEPVEPTGTSVTKATSVQTGKVAFVFEQGYVYTFAESKTYGYLMATTATLADEMKVSDEALFTLASTDNGYTITDCYNRVIGWDGSHWSFNAYTSASEGNSYWDAVMDDGKIKLSNKNNSAVYLAGKVYNNDYEMVPTDKADQTLPYLYVVKAGSSVAELEAEEAGEAVYYNLQGMKVAEPENGLYIKVQGKKATKVMIRK